MRRPHSRVEMVLLLGLCINTTGCDFDDAGTSGEVTSPVAFSVRDSVGVTIAESHDSAWTTTTAWSVDPEPILQIGSRDGAGQDDAFGSVGPVLRFSNGRVAIGDRQALEVRVFSSEGEFLRSLGGPGDGPGEIRRLDDLALLDRDDLVLTNNGLFRHEIFDSGGSHVRSLRAPDQEFFQSRSMSTPIVGWLGDGRVVVGPVASFRDLSPGRQVVEGEWHIVAADGSYEGLLARLPDRIVEAVSGSRSPRVVFYGARATVANDQLGLWYGWPERWEFHYLTSDGLERLVRLDRAREPVEDQLADHFLDWYENGPVHRVAGKPVNVDVALSMRARAERQSRGERPQPTAVSDSLPAHGSLIVSRDGHLWIQEHATVTELLDGRPDQTQTSRWTVLDPEGRWLGTVRTPEGLRIEEIGSDYILGVWLDELEVPYVRMYRIRKP